MSLGSATDRTLIPLTNGSSSAADARDLDGLRLSLGLARRTAQILDVLTDVDRPDWQVVHAAAGVCLNLIDALALVIGAAPERRELAGLLRAQLFRARDTLQEATPKRLRAFGAIGPRVPDDLDRLLVRLRLCLDCLEQTIADLPPGEL